MNITLMALGSCGDVQPAVALGIGLKRAGHNVRLATYRQFADLTTRNGLTFRPVEGDITAMLQSDGGRTMFTVPASVQRRFRVGDFRPNPSPANTWIGSAP